MKDHAKSRTGPAVPDNGGSRDQQSQSQIPRVRDEFVVALRRGRLEHSGDSEGVLIHVEANAISLTLDDGEQLVFDASEQRAALGDAA